MLKKEIKKEIRLEYDSYGYCLLQEDSDDTFEPDDETDDFQDHDDLPEHEFVTEEKIVKSGKNKGQRKYTTTLIIPPFVFKRKVDKKVGSACLFTCNGCEKLGHRIGMRA